MLRDKRFSAFFATQFLGAFNDNVYKSVLLIFIAFELSNPDDVNTLVNVAAGLFILPFFLFSATAGQIADKYEKSRLIRHIKSAEILVMFIGATAIYVHNISLQLITLFLMGAQSSFFGPVKYSILPQHLRQEELIGGNALVEGGTFLAILVGTILGGVLANYAEFGPRLAAIIVVACAVAGWLTSLRIPRADAADAGLQINWNLFTETARILRFAHGNRTVFLSILGISWFWLFGAVFLTQFPNYSRVVLGGDAGVATLMLAVFSLGIGLGSLSCERLSARHIELGLVPLGSIGMTWFGIDLAFAHPQRVAPELIGFGAFIGDAANWRVLVDLLLISVFGGFYIVPLYALVQHRSEARHRSRVIAANNVLNAAFMVAGALVSVALLNSDLTIPQLFLVLALMNAAVAVYIYTLVPEFLMRLIVWLLVHTIYRIREQELHHIPLEGPAVLVCNHVSFVDALIIAAAVSRPTRYVMYHRIFKIPIVSFVFRTAKAIPIAPASEDRELLARAYDEIAAALEAGELVCIFPEGQITADGELNTFRNGIERIVRRTPVPVVPIALRGLWGSFFSRYNRKAMRTWPRKLWSKITVIGGPAIAAADVRAPDLQARVASLLADER